MKRRTKEMQPELKNRIWLLCEKTRGAIDSGDFKQFIFTFLFGKYTSTEFRNEINNYERQFGKFDYLELSDEESLEIEEESLRDYGLFYTPSELFDYVKNKDELAVRITHVFERLANRHKGTKMEGIFENTNFNDIRIGTTLDLRNRRLQTILQAVEDIYNMNIENLFSDVFEFLMHMYATNGGSAGGEFFTPPQISQLIAKITQNQTVNELYDPTCGTGSLLIKQNGNKYYGEEINPLSAKICKMNLFVQGLHVDSFDIRCTDTLEHPKFLDKRFDLIVSNPPYSVHYNRKLLEDSEIVNQIGIAPPQSKGDWMFVAHCLHSIKDDGLVAIVQFPGTLYRDQKEREIRAHLIKKGVIDTIILLPEHIFFKTSTSTCLVIYKKNRKEDHVFLIDANAYAKKEGPFNTLSEEDMSSICALYETKTEIPYVSKLISKQEIINNDFNLCVRNYIKPKREVNNKTVNEIEKELRELNLEIEKIESNLI